MKQLNALGRWKYHVLLLGNGESRHPTWVERDDNAKGIWPRDGSKNEQSIFYFYFKKYKVELTLNIELTEQNSHVETRSHKLGYSILPIANFTQHDTDWLKPNYLNEIFLVTLILLGWYLSRKRLDMNRNYK